jgi:hypothetical protein
LDLVQVWPNQRRPAYWDLYGQSDLRLASIKLEHLDELANRMLETHKIDEAKLIAAKPKQKWGLHFDIVVDIREKLGFVRTATDQIKSLESRTEFIGTAFWQHVECSAVKYHLYNVIYNSKATTDSVSVFFNLLFRLRYSKGSIDLIKNEKQFRDSVIKKCSTPDLATFWRTHGKWFDDLLKLRNSLIHKQSIPVFVHDRKNNIAFDFFPVYDVSSDGKQLSHYDLMMGTDGRPALTFKVRGKQRVLPAPFHYVFPKEPVTYLQMASELKLRPEDFQRVTGYCDAAFEHVKSLSEIAFKESLEIIL